VISTFEDGANTLSGNVGHHPVMPRRTKFSRCLLYCFFSSNLLISLFKVTDRPMQGTSSVGTALRHCSIGPRLSKEPSVFNLKGQRYNHCKPSVQS